VPLAHTSKAVAAVNRTIRLGLERNLRLAAASSACGGKVLAGTTGSGFASIAAGFAALGLVLEASLSVEFLLAGGENKLLATLFAY
jgi:hypothetical protein